MRTSRPVILKRVLAVLVLMLSPMTPHIAEEMWEMLGNRAESHGQKWPAYREDLTREEQIEMIIQINGRLRGKILVEDELGEDETRRTGARSDPNESVLIEGKKMVKTIVVPEEAGEYRAEMEATECEMTAHGELAKPGAAQQRSGRYGEHATRNCGAGFRRAVHAIDRPPHPRAAGFFLDPAVHRCARRNSCARAGRDRAVRRSELRLRPDAPVCDPQVLKLGVPVLGICYGMQWLAHTLGGKVERAERREYGPAQLDIEQDSTLFTGVPRSSEDLEQPRRSCGRIARGFSRDRADGQRGGGGREPGEEDSTAWSFIRK